MYRRTRTALLVSGIVGALAAPAPPPGGAVEVSAEVLGKEFAPDTPEALAKYRGRVLRVDGRVAMAHDPFIYIATGEHFPTGQPVRVTLQYPDGAMPMVTAGDRLGAEGRCDRKGIFGPILTDCRLIAPPSPVARAALKKGRTPKKAAGPAEAADPPADPRAVVLRFEAPVREGEPGYRPGCTSFRLRFGPGKWRGTSVVRSLAWGDGNQGQDFWGVGSGEATYASEVVEDRDGASFVFSLNGTDWESDRVAALFRLTLPDGRPGLATAMIPVR